MSPIAKKFTLLLAITFALSSTSAIAATKKPTPKPTVKATAKATAKSTSKSTAKPKVSSTKKPTTKAKPKPRWKPRKRKKIKLTPSPSPVWPPKGFSQNGEVFARVPDQSDAKEKAALVGVISASKTLATQIKECEKFVCGVVQAGAETGCTWWEVNSNVIGTDKKALGALTTVVGGSEPQKIKTILLISPETVETGGKVVNVSVVCHHEAKPEGTQDVSYKSAAKSDS